MDADLKRSDEKSWYAVHQQSLASTKASGSSASKTASPNALDNGTNGDVLQNSTLANYSPQYPEPISPPSDASIHRPYVNLTDFLNSFSICLNPYKERINLTVRDETLCAEHISNVKDIIKSNTKRQHHDSGLE